MNIDNAVDTIRQRLTKQLFDKSVATLEQAAHTSVRVIYESCTRADGSPSFALVRIFRICTYAELPPELQAQATDDKQKYLALMATVGLEPDWCTRQGSRGHQVIPLGSVTAPMLKAAFEQIGLDTVISGIETSNELHLTATNWIERYFYVPIAPGSPYIPAQDEFVKAFGIEAVIGMGSPFIAGGACLCLCFAREAIPPEALDKFIEITPYLMTTLAARNDSGMLWDDRLIGLDAR